MRLAASSGALLRYALALSDVDRLALLLGHRRGHSLLDLGRHDQEGLLDIGRILG